MKIHDLLEKEASFLAAYKFKTAISISTTAKEPASFKVLPRRFANNIAMSCFLINDRSDLKEVITFFDGDVDYIFADTEAKQAIHLYHEAKSIVEKSKLISIKPNDTTFEACDLLLRHYFKDDLYDKNVLVIGTGNLASKLALRITERGANVSLAGRSTEKAGIITGALNLITPKYTQDMKVFNEADDVTFDAIVSFLSGPFWGEDVLETKVNDRTYVIDGGIGNFSKEFIQKMIAKNVKMARLDVRLGLAYQMLTVMDDTKFFLEQIYGESQINEITIVSGGFIGAEGAIIVDQIQQPTQVIGIANGTGGVKSMADLSNSERANIQHIDEYIREISTVSDMGVQKK